MSLDKERIGVIIGKDGETKKLIEEKTGTILIINSETAEYRIEPNLEAKPKAIDEQYEVPEVRVYNTNQIIQAINNGFNPIKALKLLDPEFTIEIIDLESALGHSDKKITRIKGRLIGEEGKIRNAMEQFAHVNISIYKKNLALIGDFEAMKIAKKAINMIIQGAPHKTVLNYLKKEFEERKKEEFTKLWKPTL